MSNHGHSKSRGFQAVVGVTLAAALAIGSAVAATPPPFVNYQGVLRSSADAPLSGAYDMEFFFWDAASGGAEIMIDRHTAVSGNAVTATGGLFNVALGGGSVSDGAGPGTYTSLDVVFRDHGEVWLEVRVAGETLTPRTRVQSAPYSLSATTAGDSSQLAGQPASYYLDSSAMPQTKLGRIVFDNAAGTGRAIEARAPDGGGYFSDSNQSGYAYVGNGDYGVQGYGNTGGGFFQDLDTSGVAYVAYGHYGVLGYGDSAGGFFADNTGSGEAYIGFQDYGIRGLGTAAGGYFSDSDSTGFAYAGIGDIGIQGYGSFAGAYFDSTVDSGYAYVGYGDIGIEGYGNGAGGFFRDRDSAAYGYVGYGAYKIYGNGAVSFVQNHPTQKDRVIVYAAPEGDEVAVYTRGSGRLSAGRADVVLGETFALVANPDLGLTAHLTSRGGACLVYVREVSTGHLSVAADDPRCTDVAFDYIVYGLRIGFESLPIVQVKRDESYLPAASTIAELGAGQTESAASSALVRFRAMHEQLAGGSVDLSRANALAEQINSGREQWLAAFADNPSHGRTTADREPVAERPGGEPVGGEPVLAGAIRPAVPAEDNRLHDSAVVERRLDGPTWMVVTEAVHAGDLLVLDESTPGALRRSSAQSASPVIGVAAGDVRSTERGALEAPVTTVGIVVEVQADAGQGSIRQGDPLVTSPLPGHVMRPIDPAAGTVVGLAIDPLDAGTGTIRALLVGR
ncbi:MAG: hypothetical protein KBD01_08390 [Acidobacteria bacterium]|nr:hypothetical protein [Acidobacteriota bacterium]